MSSEFLLARLHGEILGQMTRRGQIHLNPGLTELRSFLVQRHEEMHRLLTQSTSLGSLAFLASRHALRQGVNSSLSKCFSLFVRQSFWIQEGCAVSSEFIILWTLAQDGGRKREIAAQATKEIFQNYPATYQTACLDVMSLANRIVSELPLPPQVEPGQVTDRIAGAKDIAALLNSTAEYLLTLNMVVQSIGSASLGADPGRENVTDLFEKGSLPLPLITHFRQIFRRFVGLKKLQRGRGLLQQQSISDEIFDPDRRLFVINSLKGPLAEELCALCGVSYRDWYTKEELLASGIDLGPDEFLRGWDPRDISVPDFVRSFHEEYEKTSAVTFKPSETMRLLGEPTDLGYSKSQSRSLSELFVNFSTQGFVVVAEYFYSQESYACLLVHIFEDFEYQGTFFLIKPSLELVDSIGRLVSFQDAACKGVLVGLEDAPPRSTGLPLCITPVLAGSRAGLIEEMEYIASDGPAWLCQQTLSSGEFLWQVLPAPPHRSPPRSMTGHERCYSWVLVNGHLGGMRYRNEIGDYK